MSEFKPAVVVGKVTLQPRREIVPAKKTVQAPRAEPKPRPSRREDPHAASNANTQMLQELQYVKKQLRAVQDSYNEEGVKNLIFAQDVKALIEFLQASNEVHEGVVADDRFQAVARAVGL